MHIGPLSSHKANTLKLGYYSSDFKMKGVLYTCMNTLLGHGSVYIVKRNSELGVFMQAIRLLTDPCFTAYLNSKLIIALDKNSYTR